MALPSTCASGFSDVLTYTFHDAFLPSSVSSPKADHGTEQIQHTAVAVAPRAQHGIGVDHRGRLRPREHITLLRDIARLGEIAGAGEGVSVAQTDLGELRLVIRLTGVHDLAEHQLVERIALDVVVVDGTRIDGEAALRFESRGDELVHSAEERFQQTDAETCDKVPLLVSDGHEFFRSEHVAEAHERFHDLGKGLAALSVEYPELFVGEFHFEFHRSPFRANLPDSIMPLSRSLFNPQNKMHARTSASYAREKSCSAAHTTKNAPSDFTKRRVYMINLQDKAVFQLSAKTSAA